MAVSQKVQKLTDMLAPAVAACGFELWGIEFFPQGKRSCLRIYIDGPEGVTVDGCAMVSHQASGILDVEDPVAGEYTLEVSSPGWDRPLFSLSQYERFVGGEVLLRLLAPLNGRRRYKGVLQQVQGETLELLSEGQVVLVPFAQVDKANVVPSV
ncbi:MAG: ribosome maturation factor RimP [Fluviicoccus sp.]|uniref:ribosome maturation factor RimP n=1 Tax=Fluviicoccus sp. TaxID=2003552 RepID=UPI0027230E01|nr:ribosome maturation factor RimP [Fluviicoccus sp.]MDO8332315.1 ribosome maturation factor RimP [Fluviicoccus sp.]